MQICSQHIDNPRETYMQIEEFSLKTTDGLAQLHGDILVPDGPNEPGSVLLMIPGGGFTERDGFLGDSYTEADLMFRRIAHRVVDAGFVVARYDNRGVTGHELSIGLSKNSDDPQGDTDRYLASCVDFSARRTITPESLVDDANAVYQFVSQHSLIDPARIVVFAHSEAGLHVCRLIGNQRISPLGVMLAGTPAATPIEILQWQMIDRYVDTVLTWDSDDDGKVSTDDVARCHADSYFIEVGLTADDLTPETGHWTKSGLIQFFKTRYEKEKAKALSTPDDATYPHGDDDSQTDFVLASNRWWKQWFLDDTSTLELLSRYEGQLSFHYGEIDRQFSAAVEVSRINNATESLATIPKVTLHASRGHAFATDKPIVGPMDKEAEELLVEDLVSMLNSPLPTA